MYKKNSLKIFLEQDEKPQGAPEEDVYLKSADLKARKSKHSVDDQIDSLILRYESNSIREEDDDRLTESLFRSSLKFLLEQEEDVAEDEGGEGGEGEEATGDAPPSPTGSEAAGGKASKSQKVPDLNIDDFASRLMKI